MAQQIANYVDLVWYLSQGIAEFERSVFGTLLERQDAARYHHWQACKACRGTGIVGEPPPVRRRKRGAKPAARRRALVRRVLRADGEWCRACAGSGGSETEHPVLMTPEEQRLAVSGDWASSHDLTVHDDVLVRYAHVSRYLGRMPSDLARILVVAYEDERPRQGLTAAAADRLGLAADHVLRNGLAEAAMHARRVDAVHALLRGDRKTAAGYLWLAESWWNSLGGKAVAW